MSPRSNNRFSQFVSGWVLTAHRHAAAVITVSIILTILSAFYTIEHLSIHTDTDEMIDPDLPFRQEYNRFNQTFPQLGDNFVAILRADLPELAERAADQFVDRLQAEPALYHSIYAPGLADFFVDNGFLFLDQAELTDLTDRLAQAQPVLAQLIDRPTIASFFDILTLAIDNILNDDEEIADLERVFAELTPVIAAQNRQGDRLFSWRRLFFDDEANDTRRFVIIQPVLDPEKIQPAKKSLDAARAAADEIVSSFPEGQLTIEFTGKIALNTEELQSVTEGASLAGLLSLVFVAFVLGIGVRSLRLVFAALATLVMGLIWTGAFAIAAIGFLNIMSVAFAVLFIGLGVDFAIHTILRYQEELGGSGGQEDSFRRMALGVGRPLCICAPTTALAFLAFMPTSYSGLAQLGLIAGTGIFISLIGSLTVIPAILKFLPLHTGRRGVLGEPDIERGWIKRYGKPITLAGLASGLIAAFAIPHVKFEFDPLKLKDPSAPSVQAFLRLLDDTESSPYSLQVLADGDQAAQDLVDHLDTIPAVSRVVWFGSFIPDDQDDKIEQIEFSAFTILPLLQNPPIDEGAESVPAAEALSMFQAKLATLADSGKSMAPQARALADALAGFEAQATNDAAYERLEAAIFEFWPALLDRLEAGLQPGFVTSGDVPDEIAHRYRNGDRYRIEVFPNENLSEQKALRNFVNVVDNQAQGVTGSPVQMVRAGEIVVESMRQAVLLAAFLIILFLTIVLRNVASVILVLLPVILAAILTLAASVVLGIPFNFANVIVLPLLIGLGVDSGIHLVLRAREEAEPEELLSTSTPRAVFLSSLTTIGSFGTLIVSKHQGTASMGQLLTISVLLTLLCTLVVLPATLSWLHGRKKVTNH